MRDQQGNLVANAHIRGMVSRILKMLQYGIRPVFIFDGATPAIKKKTTVRPAYNTIIITNRASLILDESKENTRRV
jgi:hypothetical protein